MGICRGGDIPVGQHGTFQKFGCHPDQIVPDPTTVHLDDGAAVYGEEVDRVLLKQRKKDLDRLLIIESQAGFHGELPRYCISQGTQDAVDPGKITQESPAGAFAINHGRGATEIQIDGSDGVLLEFLGGAHERRDVVADHLRDDGTTSGVPGDGFEDRFVQSRGRIDPEIFRIVEIRPTIACHEPPERQVRDILHRCQGQNGSAGRNKLLQRHHHGGCIKQVFSTIDRLLYN